MLPSRRSRSGVRFSAQSVIRGACCPPASVRAATPPISAFRARADDYTNLHYRADGYLLTPNAPLATANLSSYWLENDLFIYQSLIGPGPLAVCVHLDLGFGMMTPTW